MAILKSSIPYAKALFDLAKEKNNLANIKVDANTLLSAVTLSAEFSSLISNPTVSKSTKIDILAKSFAGKLTKETSGFLALLVTKGRLSELASVCEAVIAMINKESNTIQVNLTTATSISDEAQKQIASKALGNSKYEINTFVNPEIIGGYVLEFDNKILDQSISNKIQTIKNNLDK